MSIKIALCHTREDVLNQLQALIQTHPQAGLFEIKCFLTTHSLLAEPSVYDLLITDIEKAPGDINGFELAGRMNENTKIILLSAYSASDIRSKMGNYYFELFESIDNRAINQIIPALDKYLAWREDPESCHPYLLSKRPPRPSITLKMTRKADLTLYYDDILYLQQAPTFFISQIIITTRDGAYKIRGHFHELTPLCQLLQFAPSDNGHYMVNLNYCTLDPIEKTLILAVNGKPIKTFAPSPLEYRIAEHYDSHKLHVIHNDEII